MTQSLQEEVGVGLADEIGGSKAKELLQLPRLLAHFPQAARARHGLDLHELSQTAHAVQMDLHISDEIDFPPLVHDGQDLQRLPEDGPQGMAPRQQHHFDLRAARARRVRTLIINEGILDPPLAQLEPPARHTEIRVNLTVRAHMASAQFLERGTDRALVSQARLKLKVDVLQVCRQFAPAEVCSGRRRTEPGLRYGTARAPLPTPPSEEHPPALQRVAYTISSAAETHNSSSRGPVDFAARTWENLPHTVSEEKHHGAG